MRTDLPRARISVRSVHSPSGIRLGRPGDDEGLRRVHQSNGETYRYLINNANFRSFIKVIKVDAETGCTIPYAGAGFQIYRPDGSLVTMTFTYPSVTTINTFYTNDEGMLITPEKLEYGTDTNWLKSPLLMDTCSATKAVSFDVTEDNSTEEDAVRIAEVRFSNMPRRV